MNTWVAPFVIWGLLLALLAASATASALAPGALTYAFCLSCAVAVAGLIFGWFMGLRTADGLLRIFALAALLWLALMLSLTLLDFLSR